MCGLLPADAVAVTASRYVANFKAQFFLFLLSMTIHPVHLVSAAKKRFALSEETDLEATTEESIECVSSSDPEKSKKDEALGNDGKVLLPFIISASLL